MAKNTRQRSAKQRGQTEIKDEIEESSVVKSSEAATRNRKMKRKNESEKPSVTVPVDRRKERKKIPADEVKIELPDIVHDTDDFVDSKRRNKTKCEASEVKTKAKTVKRAKGDVKRKSCTEKDAKDNVEKKISTVKTSKDDCPKKYVKGKKAKGDAAKNTAAENTETSDVENKKHLQAKPSKRNRECTPLTMSKSHSTETAESPVKRQKLTKKSKSAPNFKKAKLQNSPRKSVLLNTSVDMSDIKGLLMRFEGGGKVEETKEKASKTLTVGEAEEMADSSEDEWEEVADVGGSDAEKKRQLPTEDVQITLEATSIMRKKRKKRGFDMEEWFRLQRNRKKKEAQANAHQVHLLCLLAHGFHRSTVCSNPLVQCAIFSLIPQAYHNLKGKQWGLVKLTQITTWFNKLFPMCPDAILEPCTIVDRLLYRIQAKVVGSAEELVYLYVSMLRTLGLDVRLVMSFQPLTYKAKDLEAKTKEDDDEQGSNAKPEKSEKSPEEKIKPSTSKTRTNTTKDSKKKNNSKTESKYFEGKSKKPEQKSSKKSESKKSNKSEIKSDKQSKHLSLSQKVKKSSRRKSASKVNYTEDSGVESGEEQVEMKKRRKSKEVQDKSSLSDCNEDFEELQTSFRSPSSSRSSSSKKKKPTKIVSSDTDPESNVASGQTETNIWVEVFLESENSWICVDCLRNSVNCRENMENVATKPVQYVVAFQQGDYIAKDVTQKYARNWMLETRKLRYDVEWWDDVMSTYKDRVHESRERNEDLSMKALLTKQPLPTSVSDFKGHPLYALQRHLLKFEAIYPPDAATLGFIKGEPVYARECVHTLHSRETWLKEARMVRLKEEPYKWVKARPKKNQVNYNPDEKSLPIFGRWQTEDYIPPPAVDGKVPRNAYGNVELFKPSMLPGGTVHLNIPGLNKVARKLGIDCVAAMVGWEAHCGFSHPILEGFVVCEEFKDTLLAAWDEEQEIQREKEEEKRQKRVLDNWTRLTKGLLIRKRLKEKYDLTDPHGQADKEKKKKKSTKKSTGTSETGSPEKSGSSETRNLSTAWPMNRQAEKKTAPGKKKKHEQGPLFPFEVEIM